MLILRRKTFVCAGVLFSSWSARLGPIKLRSRESGSRLMAATQINNPLHGLTLEKILSELIEGIGWAEMGRQVEIRCFTHDPSLSSSLRFLRRTPWARAKVEALYLQYKRGQPVRT